MKRVGFTVVDRFRELGKEVTNEATWLVGDLARQRFEAVYGHAPIKALRPKTRGQGSHCFAIYPVEFVDEVDAIIRRHAQAEAAQGRLFT